VAVGNSKYLDADVVDEIKQLELVARGAVEGARIGAHRSRLRGLSTTFSHHRPYVPGDEVKHVDWRVYSRTNRYHVKLYEAETNFDANLLIDASASMRYGSDGMTKMEYAKHMAAALAFLVVEARDSAAIGVFDEVLRDYIPPRSSMAVLGDMVEILNKTEGNSRTNVGGILQSFASRIKRRGFVMLFSDLLDDEEGFIKGLNQLCFAGHNVVIFHILDHAELTFPFDGQVRFNGLEGEEAILTQPDRVRAAYLEELNKLITTYRRACDRSGADYVLVDTRRPVREVLVEYLNVRRVMSWGRI
jgi:uncharacterized protein (DUF58 family)